MRTIVVASDAPSVRAEIVTLVDEPGTDVIELHSGSDVAPTVAEHHPDLVVVDLQMGNMGGMAVCLELRLEESYGKMSHVPVLMLLDRRADVFLARRSGAEGWIVKPLDPIRIRRAITALLAGRSFHDESLQPVPVLVTSSARHPADGVDRGAPTGSPPVDPPGDGADADHAAAPS